MLTGTNRANRRPVIVFLMLAVLLSGFASIASAEKSKLEYQGNDPCDYIDNLTFDMLSANDSITWQTDLGPRLPGSNASAVLRQSIMENLSQSWSFEESSHQRENFTLTNLVGTYSPTVSNGQNVVLVAHYDSRYMAERDSNESLRNLPIDGANDGASGVAVLIEMGKIIPKLNLSHDVTLFFTDAEDQGARGDADTWSYGAAAWVDNLTESFQSNISAYIVIDMIGDEFLDFTKVDYTSDDLWDTVIPITAALGMIESETDCDGNIGLPIFNPNITRGVIDDHIPAHNSGIPAINFIDINYGEGVRSFEGYWHTHQDTADKVTAESLGYIGHTLELGLLSSAWLLHEVEVEGEINQENITLNNFEIVENNEQITVEKSSLIGYLAILTVSIILIIILAADISLKL